MTTTFAARPTIGPSSPYTFPTPRRWVLDNGLAIEHFPSANRMIVLSLVTPAGTLAEPAGSEGIATVAAFLRDEGTAQRTGEEFAAALDRIGARYRPQVTYGATVMTVSVPADGVAPALRLLAETATSATYPDQEFERVRGIIDDQAHASRLTPDSRADDALRSACFLPGDRCATPDTGTALSLGELTAADVASFDRRNLTPQQATLLIGGDLDENLLEQLIASTFGGWTRQNAHLGAARTADPARPSFVLVDRPESVQTEIRFGLVCPGPADPRFAALRIAVHVLGGAFNSRLSAVLREQKGYTYGIFASVGSMPARGLFTIATPVDTAATGPAVDDILKIVEAMRDGGITTAECSAAVDELLLRAPLEYQTAAALVNQRATEIGRRLPPGWLNEHRAALKAVTAEDASAAFAEFVSPAELSAAFVGDASAILPALTASLGSSAVTVEAL